MVEAAARILIVEDERIVAFNLQQRLQRLGYRVSALAASGEEALEIARESKPDLVLMDINIEGPIDGIETAQRLGAELRSPVVYLTAYSEDRTLERARKTRPYGYLLKPVSERELHATIQMALERRAVENELDGARIQILELNAGLERKVAERTAELQAANEELQSFSYTVAHDLRAGVRAITGYAGLMQEQYAHGIEERGRGFLHRIHSAAMGLGNMIDGLLQLARIAGSELTRGEVDLSAMVGELAHDLRESDPRREVEFVIAPGLRASVDSRLVRIALDNLLRNAWKFTAKHARARIEFGCEQTDGGAEFFVRDDGAGFDMHYANKLFGAFERLHSPGEFEGTGIGLATVRRVIERHGGRIRAEGAVAQGATFRFTLGLPGTPP